MTLAALSSLPLSPFDHATDHSRWRKKRLSFLFGPSPAANTTARRDASPLVLAAATEKLVQRNHHSPVVADKVTCCCDELTAREFAEMAGIKTMASDSSGCSSSLSSGASVDNEDHRPNIWDHEFWRPVESSKSTPAMAPAAQNSSSHPDQHKKRYRNRSPSVITKGRFQIVLGDEDDETRSLQSVPSCSTTVVEWKRKRSI